MDNIIFFDVLFRDFTIRTIEFAFKGGGDVFFKYFCRFCDFRGGGGFGGFYSEVIGVNLWKREACPLSSFGEICVGDNLRVGGFGDIISVEDYRAFGSGDIADDAAGHATRHAARHPAKGVILFRQFLGRLFRHHFLPGIDVKFGQPER